MSREKPIFSYTRLNYIGDETVITHMVDGFTLHVYESPPHFLVKSTATQPPVVVVFNTEDEAMKGLYEQTIEGQRSTRRTRSGKQTHRSRVSRTKRDAANTRRSGRT